MRGWWWVGLMVIGLWPVAAWAQNEPHRAGLVVVADGTVETHCVSFTEPEITGYELLVRSGVPFETQAAGIGAMMCSVAGTGCPAEDCFCQCQAGGDGCVYWSYWHLNAGTWQYSGAGASVYQVTDGAVDAWVWSPGGSGAAEAPPPISLAEICEVGSTASGLPDSEPVEPPTAIAAPVTREAVEPTPRLPDAEPVNGGVSSLSSYLLFAAILIGLGLLFLIARGRKETP